MEPNKFEEDFREKLNQRKIEPSDKAWDRLDAMLSVAENKKPKKDRKWLYIAASVVGFLLVGTFVFNQKKGIEKMPENTVVIKEKTEKDTVVKPALNTVTPAETEIAVVENTTTENTTKEEIKRNHKPNKTSENESKQIAESSIIIKNNPEKQSINTKTLIVEPSKKETVDQLLESAEKTVVAESSVKAKTKLKVNASDLLNQVDGELELSFREKMITKVNKNYQSVKMAVANRNQQE